MADLSSTQKKRISKPEVGLFEIIESDEPKE